MDDFRVRLEAPVDEDGLRFLRHLDNLGRLLHPGLLVIRDRLGCFDIYEFFHDCIILLRKRIRALLLETFRTDVKLAD